jgi:hypothetical protein
MISAWAREFGSLLVDVTPYFAAGLLAAVLVRRWAPLSALSRRWLRGAGGVYGAAVAGALLPGCCMAAVPMAAGLKAAGAGRGVVASFLLTSPLLSPQALVLTWGVLGWRMALARLAGTFAFLPLIGLALEALDRRRRLTADKTGDAGRDSSEPGSARLAMAPPPAPFPLWRDAADLALDYGRWLLVGLVVASLATALAPPDLLTRTLGASGPLAYLAAAAVGIPAYICEGEEVPLALGLLRLGLGPGPTLTFLLGAVGTCLPTLIVSARIIGRRTTLVVAAAWFVFSIGAGALYEVIAG